MSKNEITDIKFCTFPKLNDGENSRIVKVAVVQSSTGFKTSSDSSKVREFMCGKIRKLAEFAASEGINILCLPEMWYMPYPFVPSVELDWRKFAEKSDDGVSTTFLSGLAKELKILIISSILEECEEKFYNTCLIIDLDGKVIGKYRKHHIPPTEYDLTPGDFENPVFDTEFGKIGIAICYERHFPLKWLVLGLNGAEIVINPSSEEKNSLSERMWLVEASNAAVANGYFTISVNCVGTEEFSKSNRIKYFGSSYVSTPFGFSSEKLSEHQASLLIASIDLEDCKRAKKEISFHGNQEIEEYLMEIKKISN